MGVNARQIGNNQTVLDQADFFQSDGFSRIQGLLPANLALQVFYQNNLQPWLLVSGLGVPDTLVRSGQVYWNEVPGSPGIYSIRWRPSGVGYWRILLTYTAGAQIIGQDYDVVAAPVESSLRASFMKPCR